MATNQGKPEATCSGQREGTGSSQSLGGEGVGQLMVQFQAPRTEFGLLAFRTPKGRICIVLNPPVWSCVTVAAGNECRAERGREVAAALQRAPVADTATGRATAGPGGALTASSPPRGRLLVPPFG